MHSQSQFSKPDAECSRAGPGGQACVSIMAFITDQDQVLMDSDPGLRRRFSSLVVQLEDCSAEEPAKICRLVARLRGCTQMEQASFAGRFSGEKAAQDRFHLLAHSQEQHGNEISQQMQQNGGATKGPSGLGPTLHKETDSIP